MSDLKLFRVSGGGLSEIPGQAAQVEKSLQTLCERNLEALLGIRFVASEHSTGLVHGGRIDTLGLDEDGRRKRSCSAPTSGAKTFVRKAFRRSLPITPFGGALPINEAATKINPATFA